MTYSIANVIARLQNAAIQEKPSLTKEEVVEETLFHLIKARDELKLIIQEIDPDRFGPIKSTVIREQDLDYHRLHLCTICGKTRCISDHK